MVDIFSGLALDFHKVISVMENKIGMLTRDHTMATVAAETLQEQLNDAKDQIAKLTTALAEAQAKLVTVPPAIVNNPLVPETPAPSVITPTAGQATSLHSEPVQAEPTP